MIRKATKDDLSRIGEIFVFNNRINYYPIFKDPEFSFKILTVANVIKMIEDNNLISQLYVYDNDGIIQGFIQLVDKEIIKLYVDPFFQGLKIGEQLLNYAVEIFDSNMLWALEKNVRARSFYNKHGFFETGEKKFEEDTTEYLFKLIRK